MRDISQTATDRTHTLHLPIHRMSHVAFLLAYLHMALTHIKDQVKGYANFNCEYIKFIFKVVTDSVNIIFAIEYDVAYVVFRLAYSDGTLNYFKGQHWPLERCLDKCVCILLEHLTNLQH